MILFVHPDKMKITDFIMWADVEFCMQLDILEGKKFKTQAVSILDMSELAGLAHADVGETLYVLCHGSPGSAHTILDGHSVHWTVLGTQIGEHLGAGCRKIVLFACYAGDGDVNKRAIDLFIKGLSTKRTGVEVFAYKGATVTTTFNAIGARDGGWASNDPITTLDESTAWYPKQTSLLSHHTPQIQFDSYLLSHGKATVRDRAIAAASISERFYYAYGTRMQSEGNYFPAASANSVPVSRMS